MRVGLIADTHDRLPAIAEFAQPLRGGRRRIRAARRRLLRAVLARAAPTTRTCRSPASSAGTTATAGTPGAKPRQGWGSSCTSRRTASRSAVTSILARARHRRCAQALARRRTRSCVHGCTHQQDMRVARRHADRQSGRGVRLAVRRADGRDSRSRVEGGRVHSPRRARSGRPDRGQPDPDPRLRLAVHPAHRAARSRGARLLGDPSADALAGVDSRVEADRDHPERRPELGLRRRRARAPIPRSSTSRRCSASATGCSSSRTSRAAR